MIEVHKTESDDPEFLRVISDVIDGLIVGKTTHKLHLIHIENWFDHKWLRFAGKAMGVVAVWNEGERLTVPAFTPKRVLSHQYFAQASPDAALIEAAPPAEIHLKIWSAANLQRRLSDVAQRATLMWYSSNTKANRKGAIMAYVPTEKGYDTWYASLTADPAWRTDRTKEITRADFEKLAVTVARKDVQHADAD